jgi:uncharacterized protein
MSSATVSLAAVDRSPLLTAELCAQFHNALRSRLGSVACSLDLGRSQTTVQLEEQAWRWGARSFPYIDRYKERTIYFWNGESFHALARYTNSLIKLVPTEWGPPTFEIDGIKMLPSAHVSQYEDARQKVALIAARGKSVLDTCGGLGYFAAWCLHDGASRIISFEKNPDVMWLRSLNPWSPEGAGSADTRLQLQVGDVVEHIEHLATGSVDAVLHDPPRFGIAGELYSQSFYDQLARVLKRRGKLFHYTGTPNKLTTGRDVPGEVANRLRRAGFTPQMKLDGVLAINR